MANTHQKKIAIIGAGVTGLTAALDLAAAGHQITLYERETEVGGLCRVVPTLGGKEPIERFYHHLFTSDHDAVALFDALGLASSLEWLPPRNSFFRHGEAHSFSGPFDLLAFKPLSPLRRLLMGLHVLSTRFIRNWSPLEHETAVSWVRRHAGAPVLRNVWKPLLQAKFGDEAEAIAAIWLASKLKLRGSSQKPGMGGECLGYPRGGFGILINAIQQRLTASSVVFRLGEPVTMVRRDSGLLVRTPKREDGFDLVLSTLSPRRSADLLPQLQEPVRRDWNRIRYQANLCLMLELDRPLSPFYWTSVADQGFPFVAVIEHTNLVSSQRYGSHILYVSRYSNPDDPLFAASDSQVTQVFLEGLGRLWPSLADTAIRGRCLSRALDAQPVVRTGYSQGIPALDTPIPGVWLASMAQIFPEDRGVNYSIRLGRTVARAILGEGKGSE